MVRARQSLLTTFLFYQTLAYMGRHAGDWLAAVETGGPERARDLLGMGRVLGGIEVEVAEAGGEWHRAGVFDEAGPIAGDVQVVPLPRRSAARSPEGAPAHGEGSLAHRLGRARRAGAVPRTRAGSIPCRSSVPGGPIRWLWRPSAARSRHLITLPGDDYLLTFALPRQEAEGELFLESEGYYYEWMREEWLREEDPAMVAMIVTRPEEALRRLARPFKAHEAGAEQAFWGSRFGR